MARIMTAVEYGVNTDALVGSASGFGCRHAESRCLAGIYLRYFDHSAEAGTTSAPQVNNAKRTKAGAAVHGVWEAGIFDCSFVAFAVESLDGWLYSCAHAS